MLVPKTMHYTICTVSARCRPKRSRLTGGTAEVGGELHIVGVEQLEVATVLLAILEHQLDALCCWVLVLEGTAGKHFIMHADGCLHQ
jgi:hypothetical protein